MKHSKDIWKRPGFLIRRLQQIQTTLFLEEALKECGDLGITPVQWGILTIVSESSNISHIELSEQLGLDRSTVANVVQRLTRKGLLEIEVSSSDRRRKEVNITDKGLEIIDKVFVSTKRSQRKLLKPLSEEEQEKFVELLTRLVHENNHLGRTQLKLK